MFPPSAYSKAQIYDSSNIHICGHINYCRPRSCPPASRLICSGAYSISMLHSEENIKQTHVGFFPSFTIQPFQMTTFISSSILLFSTVILHQLIADECCKILGKSVSFQKTMLHVRASWDSY